MKSALIHDWIVSIGGGERVLAEMHALYPSPIYTLVRDENLFEGSEVFTSFLQRLPRPLKSYRYFLPLFPLAIEQFDLSSYDLILSSSHAVAKGVITRHDQLHICYCHTPMRYAWDLYHEYLKGLRSVKKTMARLVLHYLRNWDVHSHHRVDHFIANSATAAQRIEKIYGRKAEVIYPPVRTECFDWRKKREDYYLVVSRLVPYKRVDLIVEAFQKMPEKKLIVIGEGPELSKIKAKAGKNTEFLGYQKDEIVKDFLEKARAFIFAAEEDFGIAPVEALASGTPVIAYGKGGVKESVKEGISGLFFEAQSCESLIRVLNLFEKTRDSFDPERIHRQAECFSAARFREKFQNFVEKKQQEFRV